MLPQPSTARPSDDGSGAGADDEVAPAGRTRPFGMRAERHMSTACSQSDDRAL